MVNCFRKRINDALQANITCLKSTIEAVVKKVWNMFDVNNKNIRKMSLTYFTSSSSVPIIDFEQVNVSWAETSAMDLFTRIVKG